MTRILYGLGLSPWTERARWALDHHGVEHEYREHIPMLGEVFLRRRAGVKRASVPLFIDGDEVVMGSPEIARHAEKTGRGAPLFPLDRDADVVRWVELAERALGVGRAWYMKRLPESRAAQIEALPPFIPGALRGLLAPTAVTGSRFLAKKYAVPSDAEAAVESTLRPALREIRAALAGRQYVLATSTFSFADLTLAAAMQVVRPRHDSKLGPATRDAWTNDAVAREFGDLLEWRDTIYEKHR